VPQRLGYVALRSIKDKLNLDKRMCELE